MEEVIRLSGIPTVPRYRLGEEIANGVIHGVGVVFAVVALAVLTAYAHWFGTIRHIVSCSIFGVTLLILYLASTLYHTVQPPRAKAVLRVVDHSAIFLLIAGTYTPFTLVNLRGPWGWSLFGLVWGLAILGIILQFSLLKRFTFLRVLLYVAMGWVVIVAIKPLVVSVPPLGLVLLIAGGVAYTAGIGFYVWHRLPYHHAVWHVFVLAGSVFHFFSVFYSVIPSMA
jgi:hemolysin III